MRRAILSTVLSLSVAGLAGCGPSNDSPKVSTHTNSDGTQSVTVTDDKGATVTVAGGPGATANMPAYAPMFPGATVESTITTPDKGGMVALKTSATQQAVIDFYKKSAAAAGFKDVMTMNMGESISYSASDEKNHHTLSIIAVKSNDGTTVQVTWN